MAGSDRCVHHAQPRTAAQAQAARKNGERHRFFSKFLDERDLAHLASTRESLEDLEEVQRELAAYALLRLGRMAAWEANPENKPSPLTAVAFERAQRAIAALPRHVEDKGFDELELSRIVDTMSKRPEIFIRRLRPELQERVRALLREEGVDLDAA